MSIKLTLVPALALLALLATGCSEQDSMQTEQAEPEQAPAGEMAAPEADTAGTMAAAEEAAGDVMGAAEEAAGETMATAEDAAGEMMAAADDAISAASVDGQQVYQANCQACHNAGVAGAPKLGDKAAWADRIAKGNDALLSSVINGLNAMPPKGACMSCSDEDLGAAVAYMVEQSS